MIRGESSVNSTLWCIVMEYDWWSIPNLWYSYILFLQLIYFCLRIKPRYLGEIQYGSSSETHCQSSTHVCLHVLTHGQTFWIFLVLMKKSCSVQNGFFTLCTDGNGEVTNHVILLTLASVNNDYYMHWTSLLLFFKASTSH